MIWRLEEKSVPLNFKKYLVFSSFVKVYLLNVSLTKCRLDIRYNTKLQKALSQAKKEARAANLDPNEVGLLWLVFLSFRRNLALKNDSRGSSRLEVVSAEEEGYERPSSSFYLGSPQK